MKKFPNAFVIIIGAIVTGWLLTFIIPQGTYQRISDTESGRTIVVPDSYQQMEAPHLSLFDMLVAIPRGISERSETIVLILLIGGCFYVLEKTGALTNGLNHLIRLLTGREVLALIFISMLFIGGGVTIGMQEEAIAMVPILLLFARNLGYNALTVVYICYGSTVIGSAFSPSNPFGVIIAQKEAELDLISGASFRLVVLLIVSIVWIGYIVSYANRHRAERTRDVVERELLTSRNKIILFLLVLTFLIVIYGLLELNWGFNEMSASFFGLGIIGGLIGKLGITRTTEYYVDGFKDILFAAIIVGLSNSITLLLKEGMIIDTIVLWLFGPLQYLSPAVSAVLMMISHAILHFPIPSYSGQAMLTMPILTPLSDLIGLSRQVCVLAFQYGAIMMDMIIPTNGALMAVLTICAVPYNQWLKFIARILLLIMAIAAVAIFIGVAIGY